LPITADDFSVRDVRIPRYILYSVHIPTDISQNLYLSHKCMSDQFAKLDREEVRGGDGGEGWERGSLKGV
jgi:hypothetical protein